MKRGILEALKNQGRAWDERSGVGLNLSICFFLGVEDFAFSKCTRKHSCLATPPPRRGKAELCLMIWYVLFL